MGFWKNRKEKNERNRRLNSLSEEEVETLNLEEKNAYIGVALNLVNRRGRLNATKDFPVPNDSGELITLEEHDRAIEEQNNKEDYNQEEEN